MRPPVVGHLVCHVLLVESPKGLVLVDSGFGLAALADPRRLVGPVAPMMRLARDPAETALHQVQALGFRREDVEHVVLTHLDADHVGGIADFPDAVVHTTAVELNTAQAPPTRAERGRYRPVLWAHGPRWRRYEGADARPWNRFDAAHPLEGLDGFALVPMPGHTRGSAAVAVDTGDGLLVHAGDAAFHRSTLAGPTSPRLDRRPRRAVLAMEQLLAVDRGQVRANHARLAELAATDGVDVVLAHDPVLLERYRG